MEKCWPKSKVLNDENINEHLMNILRYSLMDMCVCLCEIEWAMSVYVSQYVVCSVGIYVHIANCNVHFSFLTCIFGNWTSVRDLRASVLCYGNYGLNTVNEIDYGKWKIETEFEMLVVCDQIYSLSNLIWTSFLSTHFSNVLYLSM